ncbi:MAG TPA: flagellar biosynthesis anti-sigma factor FlgM, partial [Bryobacteraceae bacterium]|nr:flagellar biosynthesis anti-sigma factor FlgM [Bryobacteraceae bacterium]
ASTGTVRSQEAQGPGQKPRAAEPAAANDTGSSDDIHLSELVRSLRSLAADSPERQARMEQLTRSYVSGVYRTDAHGTASKMIDDALQRS